MAQVLDLNMKNGLLENFRPIINAAGYGNDLIDQVLCMRIIPMPDVICQVRI